MIQKIEINGVHFQVDEDLEKYTKRKIGHLDKYMSKHAKVSAHAEVKLKESKAKDKKQCQCEVILHLPKETLMVKETTINMYAAVDIVEAKLKNQIKKYKDTQESAKFHQRVIRRFRREL
ncbi:MAG: putative sigma-54 modulation protein [Patescibacteria group bacterium]|nr:putative sigma-54 modulation protein [Patescibacteria group bacterium]